MIKANYHTTIVEFFLINKFRDAPDAVLSFPDIRPAAYPTYLNSGNKHLHICVFQDKKASGLC